MSKYKPFTFRLKIPNNPILLQPLRMILKMLFTLTSCSLRMLGKPVFHAEEIVSHKLAYVLTISLTTY